MKLMFLDESGNHSLERIDHNYPGPDYDDLMAGVDTVIKRGYIDSSRLYVSGCSGGGVLSSWVIGHTDRFAAAALCTSGEPRDSDGPVAGVVEVVEPVSEPEPEPDEHPTASNARVAATTATTLRGVRWGVTTTLRSRRR